jgi:hypothetical protein
MGKRFPVGTVSKVHGWWLGRWRKKGERRVQRLGRVGEMNKSEAKEKLAEILRPINASAEGNHHVAAYEYTGDQSADRVDASVAQPFLVFP